MTCLVSDGIVVDRNALAVSVRELDASEVEHARLAEEWSALEARADTSFFCSWGWIGTWLAVLPPERRRLLVTIADGGRTVALAIVIPGTRRLLRLLPRPVARLHDSSVVAERGATIEHNGLLVARGREADPAIWDAIWQELRRRGIAELSIPYVARTRFAVPEGTVLTPNATTPAPFIDLAKTDRQGRVAESLMSRNGREQLRRARKAYQARGPLVARTAETEEEAFVFLARLEALHQATWTERGRPGSFADPFFVAFHRRLIETRFAADEIELLAVTAGEAEVGYLYNFRYRDRIYAYQSGFAYETDRRLKPGLICHEAAIDRVAAQPSLRFYDFLGGDSRFKRGFANGAETLESVTISRKGFLIGLENTVKKLLSRKEAGSGDGGAKGVD